MPTVLLCEDDEANSDVLRRRLTRRGYQVLCADNGLDGIEIVHSQQPDLILLDMRMPLLDGWEMARQLRQDPATRAIPIIALTAHAIAGDREKTLAAGCDEYESKPVDFARLLGKIEFLLEKRPAEPAAAEGAAG